MAGTASTVVITPASADAAAVVGLVGKEGAVIRLTLAPFLYYALLPGAIGYSVVWFAQRGALNLGTVLATTIALAAVVAIAKLSRKPPDSR